MVFFLLVIVAELDQNIITRFQGLDDLLQTPLAEEGIERERPLSA